MFAWENKWVCPPPYLVDAGLWRRDVGGRVVLGGRRKDVEESGLLRVLGHVDAALRPLPAEVVPERGFGQWQEVEEIRVVLEGRLLLFTLIQTFLVTWSPAITCRQHWQNDNQTHHSSARTRFWHRRHSEYFLWHCSALHNKEPHHFSVKNTFYRMKTLLLFNFWLELSWIKFQQVELSFKNCFHHQLDVRRYFWSCFVDWMQRCCLYGLVLKKIWDQLVSS